MGHWVKLSAFALIVWACTPTREPEPTGPPLGDASPCHAACETLARLLCPEARPTDAGDSCESVCESVAESGTITLCPGRVAGAKDCDEARRRSQCENVD